MVVSLHTFFCQLDTVIDPFKKGNPQLAFKILDLCRDRRLGVAHTFCRSGKTAQGSNLYKTFKITDFHILSFLVSKKMMLFI